MIKYKQAHHTSIRIVSSAMTLWLLAACGTQTSTHEKGLQNLHHAINSYRFIAYTPTDLRIINGQIQTASAQQIRKDLEKLREDFHGLILYSSSDGVEQVPTIARELGFRAIILGIWSPHSNTERAHVTRLVRAHPELIVGVCVGNEMLLAKRMEWHTLRKAMRDLRKALPGTPISTAEPFYYYLNQEPEDFIAEQDFLLPSIHPIHEKWFSQASGRMEVDFVLDVISRLQAMTDKPLLVKETGLPSGPEEKGFNEQRQAGFWQTLTQALPETRTFGVTYFEAYDHPWKVDNAYAEFGHSPEEAFWGFYSAQGQAKPVMKLLRQQWHLQEKSAP